jgi:preprotein translocase subunit Sec63
MSIAGRLWRILKTEFNSRLGRFEQHSRQSGESWTDESYTSRKPNVSTEEAKRAQYYRMLELPNGAPLYNVKASYKRLMKKYHPDRFQSDEQRATATELVKRLNEAYAYLEKYLEEKEKSEK